MFSRESLFAGASRQLALLSEIPLELQPHELPPLVVVQMILVSGRGLLAWTMSRVLFQHGDYVIMGLLVLKHKITCSYIIFNLPLKTVRNMKLYSHLGS